METIELSSYVTNETMAMAEKYLDPQVEDIRRHERVKGFQCPTSTGCN